MVPYYDRNNILLYHGSIGRVEIIDVSKGKNYKDFGRGFYTTTDKEQAERFAKIVARRNGIDRGYINIYTVSKLTADMKALIFNSADIVWLDFICLNRNTSGKPHNYDIAIGPVADDEAAKIIKDYTHGDYGDPRDIDVKLRVIQRLQSQRLKNQIYLGTSSVVEKLQFKGGYEVWV